MTPWAIIVGINLHPEEAELSPLDGAVADAVDFAEWCLDPAGGAVAKERLFFWTHPAPDPAIVGPLLTDWNTSPSPWPRPVGRKTFIPDMDGSAPKAGHLRALCEQMTGSLFDSADEHRVYVLFAGHGVQVERDGVKETCFLTGDFVDGQGLLPCGQMSRSLLANGFSEVLMFLDCCRTRLDNRTPMPNLFPPGAGGGKLMGLARAANDGQTSFEVPDKPPKRGVFTQLLTEGLRTERMNGALTFDDLGRFVRKRTPSLLGGRGPQDPQFVTDPPNPRDPVLLVSGPPQVITRDIVINFSPDVPDGARIVLVNENGEPFGPPIIKAGPQHRLAAPLGLYALECGKPRRIRPVQHAGPGDKHVPF